MLISDLRSAIHDVLKSIPLLVDVTWSEVPYGVTWSKQTAHGHFACNVAMLLAKTLKKSPKQIAEILAPNFNQIDIITRVEIAGPGFINIYLSETVWLNVLASVHAKGKRYGHSTAGTGQRIHLEYVSANPTGPLHVGHGRGGALGSALANVLKTAGYLVDEYYYVNDAGRQMRLLGLSTLVRVLQISHPSLVLPKGCYQGDYIVEIAKDWHQQHAFDCAALVPLVQQTSVEDDAALDALISEVSALITPVKFDAVCQFAGEKILADIRDDLSALQVEMHWFSEKTLYAQGDVEALIQDLTTANAVYEKDHALWFRASDFGDEKDRVLKRANGQMTYFAADAAYHRLKIQSHHHVINIWGADHHGYVPRVRAVLQALGYNTANFQCLLLQFVSLIEAGERVSMSTRAGAFVTLRQLREDVGVDACRFFYLMRKPDQAIEFDLDLARSQSQDNPVYYVQYAFARICSIFKQYDLPVDAHLEINNISLAQLGQHALPLLMKLAQYPEVLAHCVRDRAVHPLTTYLYELASDFHRYYNVTPCLVACQTTCHARLALLRGVQLVIEQALALLGVQAPQSM